MMRLTEKLQPFINNENSARYRSYSLKNILRLLHAQGNPHEDFKSVHIAGTNGKGSTACFLNGILIEAGFRTGLYTSPHLLKINERIKINNRDISGRELNRIIDEIFLILQEMKDIQPTFFDILTAAAFAYFREKKIDIAVIETGLGGRLDSTNVLTPECSVITNISLDHTPVLGATVKEIASEKAGIIKTGIPVITSNTDDSVLKILRNCSMFRKTRLYTIGKDFHINSIKKYGAGFTFDYQFSDGSHAIAVKNIILNSIASFQTINSSLAITAALIVSGFSIPEKKIGAAIKKTVLPGRLQVLAKKPFVVFDPGHNPSAVETSLEQILNFYKNKKIVSILSVMKDKDYTSIINILSKKGIEIIYYELPEERCYRPSLEKKKGDLEICGSRKVLIKKISERMNDRTLFYFTGTFRHYRTALYIARKLNE